MNLVRSPSRNQTFRVGNRWLCVLDDIAVNVLPLTVTKASVALCSKLDAEDAITPEDIGTKRSQATHSTSSRIVVSSLSNLVALEEVNTRRRKLNHLGYFNRNKVFHACKTNRSVLQNVDWRVVRHVRKNIPKSKRMNDTAECLGSFVIRTNRTTRKRLDCITNLIQAKRSETPAKLETQ